jgi:hypothetical protein
LMGFPTVMFRTSTALSMSRKLQLPNRAV